MSWLFLVVDFGNTALTIPTNEDAWPDQTQDRTFPYSATLRSDGDSRKASPVHTEIKKADCICLLIVSQSTDLIHAFFSVTMNWFGTKKKAEATTVSASSSTKPSDPTTTIVTLRENILNQEKRCVSAESIFFSVPPWTLWLTIPLLFDLRLQRRTH